jgi:predicted DCC family thiol-disulfide oxidoreductase YuxK
MDFNEPVLFFDGDCGFCNKSVQFVLQHEKQQHLNFVSLQSSFAHDFFKSRKLPSPDLSTFYFFNGTHLFERSTAALKVIYYLKWYCKPILIGWIVPKKLRDPLYNFVAKRRTKLAKGFCLIPNQVQKNRFYLN